MASVKTYWSFAEIEKDSPDRAERLGAKCTPIELASDVKQAFERAYGTGKIRLGLEPASGNSDDVRAVVQFHVGEALFDRFFNSHAGYRAQFRKNCQSGNRFTARLVTQLRGCLGLLSGSSVTATYLNADFETVGEKQVAVSTLLQSLDPDMSKFCYCALRIARDGPPETLAISFSGPKLLMDRSEHWAAPYAEEADAWLDLKGAFLGKQGPYQPKDPRVRAQKLAQTGEF